MFWIHYMAVWAIPENKQTNFWVGIITVERRLHLLRADNVTPQWESNNGLNVLPVCVFAIMFNFQTALRVSYSHRKQGGNCYRSFSPISRAVYHTLVYFLAS